MEMEDAWSGDVKNLRKMVEVGKIAEWRKSWIWTRWWRFGRFKESQWKGGVREVVRLEERGKEPWKERWR